METKPLYKIFLTYANYPFAESPDNIDRFYNAVRAYQCEFAGTFPPIEKGYYAPLRTSVIPQGMDALFSDVKEISQSHETLAFAERRRLSKKAQYDGLGIGDPLFFDLAFASVFGYLDESCDPCRHTDKNGIKCHECDQVSFVEMLDVAVKGEPFYDFDVTTELLEARNKHARNQYFIFRYNDGARRFEHKTLLDMQNYLNDLKNTMPTKEIFRCLVYSFVGFSFFDFVNEWKNGKYKKLPLNRCQFCNDFFIPERTSRGSGEYDRCYKNDCERAYDRIKKSTQRADDPVKYMS